MSNCWYLINGNNSADVSLDKVKSRSTGLHEIGAVNRADNISAPIDEFQKIIQDVEEALEIDENKSRYGLVDFVQALVGVLDRAADYRADRYYQSAKSYRSQMEPEILTFFLDT